MIPAATIRRWISVLLNAGQYDLAQQYLNELTAREADTRTYSREIAA